MKTGFVFTNYNNSNYTIACIESINKIYNKNDSFIVVIDNNSELEDTRKLEPLKVEHDNLEIIFNQENVGYFSGLNLGLKYLNEINYDADFVIIGNNDLVFPLGFKDQISEKKAMISKYAVVSPNLVTLDGVNQNPHVLNKVSKIRELMYDLYYSNFYLAKIMQVVGRMTYKFTRRGDEKSHEIGQEIGQGYGACYILTRIFLTKFEKLWAPTFLMGEELFLSIQLKNEGLSIYYEPSILVEHHDHATLNKVPSRKLWEISKESHKVYRKYVKNLLKAQNEKLSNLY